MFLSKMNKGNLEISQGFEWHSEGRRRDQEESRSVGQNDRRSLENVSATCTCTFRPWKDIKQMRDIRFQFPWGRLQGDFQLDLQIEDSPTPSFESFAIDRAQGLVDAYVFSRFVNIFFSFPIQAANNFFKNRFNSISYLNSL